MTQCEDTLLLDANERLRCHRPLPHYGHHGWLSETEELEWYRPTGHQLQLTYVRKMLVTEPVRVRADEEAMAYDG